MRLPFRPLSALLLVLIIAGVAGATIAVDAKMSPSPSSPAAPPTPSSPKLTAFTLPGPRLLRAMRAVMRRTGSYRVAAIIRIAYPGQRLTIHDVFDISLTHHAAHGTSLERIVGFTPRTLTNRDAWFVVNGIVLDEVNGVKRCGKGGDAFVYTPTYLTGNALFAGYRHASVLSRINLGPTTVDGVPVWHARRVLLRHKEAVPVFADYYIARHGFQLVRELWRFAPGNRPTTAAGSSWARADYSAWGERVVVKLPPRPRLTGQCRRLFSGKTT